MKRKSVYLLVGLAAILVIVVGAIYVHSKNSAPQAAAGQQIVLDQNSVTLIKTLRTSSGTTLGDVYASYIGNTNVFTALYIVTSTDGNNNIIYKIDNNGFSNTLGKQLDIASSGFYGFQISAIGNDYLSVHALYNGGKEISDDIVIRWNPDEQVFEIDPNSSAQMGSVLVGTLTAPDGSALGQIYVDYISGNIFGTLHVMQEVNGKEKEIYEVNALGFYNTALGTKDISISPNNFYGYQLTGIGSDYFSLELLTNNGNDVSGNFTVGWDSVKKAFEIQSSTPQNAT